MIPWFQFKIRDRVIMDSEGFLSSINRGELPVNLKDAYMTPRAHRELLELGGWKLNVVSTIDGSANSEVLIKGWESLGKLVPIDRLFLPFLYSTVIDYVRLRFMDAEPQWAKLLRLCYWYWRCLEINDSSFRHKQSEIKRQIRKPLINVEKELGANVRDFIDRNIKLGTVVTNYANELMFAALCHRLGYAVNFHKKHDFLVNSVPAEVKSVYSHIRLDKWDDGAPRMTIGGQALGESVNMPQELLKFVTSRKIWGHVGKAIAQGGLIVFLDATRTFTGSMLALLTQFLTLSSQDSTR